MIFVVVLLILVFGVVSPMLCAWFVSRNLRNDMELNWKRQNQLRESSEQISKQTQEAAQIVIDGQNTLYEAINEVAQVVSNHNTFVDSHFQKLNELMNSDMMAARRDELIRTKELKVALDRIVTLTTLSRQQPDVRYITAIESATNRIEDLETILGLRTYETLE